MPAVSGRTVHTAGGQNITSTRRGTKVTAPKGVPVSKPAGGSASHISSAAATHPTVTTITSTGGSRYATHTIGSPHTLTGPSPKALRKIHAQVQAEKQRRALVTQAQHNLAKLAKPKIIHQLNKAGTISGPKELKMLKAAAPHVVLHYGNRFNPEVVHNVLHSIGPSLPNLPQNQKPKTPGGGSQGLRRPPGGSKSDITARQLRKAGLKPKQAKRVAARVQKRAKLQPGGQKPKKHSFYVSPFKRSQSAVQTRTDAGVDYYGQGQIGAIGKGKVLSTTSGFGGQYGTQGVLYKLLAGPKKGKKVYIYEGVNPTVSAGDVVKPGQKVGDFTGAIETGWSDKSGTPIAFAKGTALPDTASQGGHYSPQGYNFLKFSSRLGAAQAPPPKNVSPTDPRLDPHIDVAGKGKPVRVSGGGPVASKPTKILKAPVSSSLSKSQQIFAAVLAHQTGLDPRVTGAWLHGEEPAATVNPATGNHNWLNIGPGDTGPQYSDPIKGAKYTANLVNTSSNYAGIRASVGQPLSAQLAAIVASPWGTKDLSATSADSFGTKKINVNVPIAGPPVGAVGGSVPAAPVSMGASTAASSSASAPTSAGATTQQGKPLTRKQQAARQAQLLAERRRRAVLHSAITALGQTTPKPPTPTVSSPSTSARKISLGLSG